MLNAIFIVTGLILIVLGIVLLFKKPAKKDGVMNAKPAPVSKTPTAVLVILGLVSILFSASFTIIPTGYTGVRVTFGQVEKKTLNNGFNFHAPFIQEIVLVNNKQQDIRFNENSISSETSERNTVIFKGITVTYQINPEKSAWIYANVTNYQDGLVSEPLVASAIKTSSKTLSPIDCTNRSILEPKAKENIQKSLDEKYGNDVVYVNKVVINDASFDAEYDEKIAKKQQAQIDYETQQIENKKNIEKAEADATVTKTNAQAKADARVIEAKAEADANKTISDSINEKVLQNKYYETWDGKLPQTVVGSDASSSVLIGASSAQADQSSGKTSEKAEKAAENKDAEETAEN